MNIFITGANGFIGRHIVKKLENQHHSIIACCRNSRPGSSKKASTTILQLDFKDMLTANNWLAYLRDIDVVINCVGIIAETRQQSFQTLHTHVPIALFHAAEQAKVKKIIQISALGADDSAQSAYHLSKKAADDELQSLNLDWMILQPSIVYGQGAQSMALFHALAALPILALIDGGKQLMQPVHVKDVAETVARCIETTTPMQQTLELVGPDKISYAQLLRSLRKRLQKNPAFEFTFPGELAERTVFLGALLDEPTLKAENIAMLRRGNHANAQAISDFLGHPTASLEQQLFSKPATQAERWHAGLYFLRPLLRLTLAFLWIWSGIVSIFFYPHELSYQFLAASNISGIAAPIMLYSLAVMDILLGLATLLYSRLRHIILLQLSVIILYTLSISLTLPEFWFHPFGPVLKNIPLWVTLLVLLTLEGEKP